MLRWFAPALDVLNRSQLRDTMGVIARHECHGTLRRLSRQVYLVSATTIEPLGAPAAAKQPPRRGADTRPR